MSKAIEDTQPSATDEHPLPERLSEDHIALFSPAVQGMTAATEAVQQAQAQLAQARLRQERAAGALQYVLDYLAPRYAMKPGDNIDEQGVIVRGK